MSATKIVRKPVTGLGRLVEPFRILLDNRSLTWLLGAFGAMTLAEWGYVTALAVDAFRLQGSVAVGLVGFRLFIASIGNRDYPVLQGIFLLTAIAVVVANVATDMLYAALDPRVRGSYGRHA